MQRTSWILKLAHEILQWSFPKEPMGEAAPASETVRGLLQCLGAATFPPCKCFA